MSGGPTLAPAWTELPRGWILCLLSPQTAARGDQDGDEEEEEDDEDFVEVPEKEGYEACVPAHLWPEDGEWPQDGRGLGGGPCSVLGVQGPRSYSPGQGALSPGVL